MIRLLILVISLALAACSSAPKPAPIVTPPQVERSPVLVLPRDGAYPQRITNTHNANTYTVNGERLGRCRERGDFMYCETCYQYEGQIRPTCYWTRQQ